jgi:chromosome segregation ATPase
VDPDLVTRNEEGKAYAVRYEAANAMLLNEFLKEHRNVQQLEETVAQQRNDFQAINEQQQKEFESKIAQQQKQIEALNAAVQKADAQLESSGRALHAIANNH